MNNFDIDPYHALKSLLEVTSPHLGESFLKVVCHELKKLFDADMVFITEAINSNPTTKVKILYATNSNLPDSFELEGTPCQLVFEDKIIQINKRLNLEFDKAKTTSFESFYGIPLHSKDSLCIGHIGIFSEKKRIIPNYIEDIALIFARRIEVEYQREILEKENIKIYIELKEMIITDSLTGLFNRRHFNAISKDTLLQIKRDIIIASLKYLSDLLQKNTREGIDYLFRVGGEEFAIISINSSLQDSYLHLERIQNTLVNDKDNSLNITLSVGIDVFAKDDKSFDAVCKRADIKMYKAKNSGKNCIVT
jgi:two-component system cell cycle response regulator